MKDVYFNKKVYDFVKEKYDVLKGIPNLDEYNRTNNIKELD